MTKDNQISLGRATKAAFIGVGISLALLVPPVIHFLTGPLSTIIGGYVAGSRERVDPPGGLLIGAMMGVIIACIVAGILLIILAASASVPNVAVQISADKVAPIALAAIFFAVVTSSLGAIIGGHRARRHPGKMEPIEK